MKIVNMNILIVVDTDTEKRNRVCEIIEAAGHKVKVAHSIKDAVEKMPQIDGVITEMYFNPYGEDRDLEKKYDLDTNPPPSGLCIIIAAQYFSKPVVVCMGPDNETPIGKIKIKKWGRKWKWLYDVLQPGPLKWTEMEPGVTHRHIYSDYSRFGCSFTGGANWEDALSRLSRGKPAG